MYSREAYVAIKAEVSENTYVKPDVFLPVLKVDVPVLYRSNPSMPILGNRSLNINPVKDLIEAPTGSLTVTCEPKTFGHFLKSVFGVMTSGVYFPITSASANFTVGETVTGGASSKTAVILAYSKESDYMLVGTLSGVFTDGETLTGGASLSTATLGNQAATVYGHEAEAPQSSLPTYTMEIGIKNEAYRLGGVRFIGINSITHQDNMIVADMAVMARSAFLMARVTAITTSGAGAQTIALDQTTGLLESDTIKVFRPSTGAFIDFSASTVKTHTITSVDSEIQITVTNLETSLAVGDLIVFAPQTASYTLGTEFCWIGGSTVRIADDIDTAISASEDSIEEFDFSIQNELEQRHGANGVNVVNRYPTSNLLKKMSGEGSLKRAYTDMTYLDKVRQSQKTAMQVKHTGALIGSTTINNSLELRVPYAVLRPYLPALEEDKLLDDELEFDMYRSSADGYTVKALLVNDVASY